MGISFLSETVKQLRQEFRKAYEAGDLRKVRRISVLLMVAEQKTVSQIIATWRVTRQTIESWLKAFFYEGIGETSAWHLSTGALAGADFI